MIKDSKSGKQTVVQKTAVTNTGPVSGPDAGTGTIPAVPEAEGQVGPAAEPNPAQQAAAVGSEAVPAAAPTPVEMVQLGRDEYEKLVARAAEAEKTRELMLRVAADFENYKKRAARERQEATMFANQELVLKLLPIMDNFELAVAHAGNTGDTAGAELVRSFAEGMRMILQQLRSVLAAFGVEEIDASGSMFDPNIHDAVAQEASTEVPEGSVLRQIRKGYKLHGRVLRPAAVVVAKRPGPVPESGGSGTANS